jgi:hypothetical protein
VELFERELRALLLLHVFAELHDLQLAERVVEVCRVARAAFGLYQAGLVRLVALFDEEIDRLAASNNMKPAELRRSLDRADQMPAVRSEWKKSKALEWLLEHVEIVDADGQPIDRALLEPDPNTPDAYDPEAEGPNSETSAEDPSDSQDQETGEP